MSIVIGTQTYEPTVNGQGAFVVHLAEALALSGREVYVITLSGRPQDELRERNGVHVCALSSITFGLIDDHFILPLPDGKGTRRLLRVIEPEIVHIQDHYALSARVASAARKAHLPTLGTNHFLPDNLIPYFPIISKVEAGVELLRNSLWNQVLEVYNQLDYVVAPTETAAEILRRNGLAVPVRAISNGINLERFRPMPDLDRAGVRRKFGLSPERLLFLYVGRVDLDKGLATLLKAVGLLKRRDVQIAIAGRGNDAGHLKKLAHELGLGDRLVFTGYIPDADLPALLNSADLFVMPSTIELQSIATLEAMSSGLPVLAANASALPELVFEGENGWLFEPGSHAHAADRLEEIAGQVDKLPAMGRVSRRMAEGHSLQCTLQSYLALYHQLNPALLLKENEDEIPFQYHRSV